VQVAALGHNLIEQYPDLFSALPFSCHPLQPVFPAVTCTAQAALRTGMPTEQHGIVANGFLDRDLRQTFFWTQSNRLLPRQRIWDTFRNAGNPVGVMFFQQSLGDNVDLILSPAPIHKHHGGMIQDCYSQPPGLYPQLCSSLGRPFRLRHYWGPMASFKATEWIVDATIEVIRERETAPKLLFTYLPHMDYVLQKHGPNNHEHVKRALRQTIAKLVLLTRTAADLQYDVVVAGDYAVAPVQQVVYPNRILQEARLFTPRRVGQLTYPDLYTSRAVAVVDHQIAHVYVHDPNDIPRTRDVLTKVPGVAEVLNHDFLPHPRSGELIAVAESDAWFAYPWWTEAGNAPDYATHVDIHNKIGFDPAELFWGSLPPRISTDPRSTSGGRTASHHMTKYSSISATRLHQANFHCFI